MTNISQSFQIFTDTQIVISQFGAQADANRVTKSISWDARNYTLAKATLTMKASQPYASGAQLDAFVNDDDSATIYWGGFDSSSHEAKGDATASLVNGANHFYMHYKTALPVLPFTSATCTASLTLDAIFTYIGSGTPSNNPASAGITLLSWSQIKEDFRKFTSNTMNLVVLAVVAVIVVLGLWAVISAYGGGGMTRAFTGLREDLQKSIGALKEKGSELASKAKGKAQEAKGRLDVELAERERERSAR